MLKESLAHAAAGSGVAEDCEAVLGAALVRATPGMARGSVESLAHAAAGSGVAEDCEAVSGAALVRATPGMARGSVAAVAGTSAAPAVAPATVHCGESRCWLIVASGTFLPQTGQAQKREPELPHASMDAPLAGAADLGRFKKRSIGDFSRQ